MATKESTAILQSNTMNTFVETYNMLCAYLGVEESPFVLYGGNKEHRRAIMLNELANSTKDLVERVLAQSQETVILDVKLEK